MSTVVPPPINDPKVKTSLMMAMMTLSNINGNDMNNNNHNILLYNYRQSRGESSQKSLTKTSDDRDGGLKANGLQKRYLTMKGYSPLMRETKSY